MVHQHQCNSSEREKKICNVKSKRSLCLFMSYHLIIWNQRMHVLVVVGLAHPLAHLWICVRLRRKREETLRRRGNAKQWWWRCNLFFLGGGSSTVIKHMHARTRAHTHALRGLYCPLAHVDAVTLIWVLGWNQLPTKNFWQHIELP